jgi:genome maintenance exonuclease 1
VRLIKEENKFIITDLKRENKYDYKKYTRQEEHGSRTYNVGDKKIPSVTTILSATQSEEKKASLDRWRERVGYQEAQRITQQAATRGTEMHYVLENYIDGRGYLNLSPEGAQARLMAHEIVQNLDKLKIVWGNEVSLAYEDLWAGATDVVGLYDDQPTIIDFKQSNKPKREEYVEDYYYQIAAYSLAHKKQYGPITQGLICVCTKDKLYQEFKMNEVKLSEYEDKWLERVHKYHESKATSESVPQES